MASVHSLTEGDGMPDTSRPFHNHISHQWSASARLCVPSPLRVSPCIEYHSFIHSSSIVFVSFDHPPPLFSPPGPLNGWWRSCRTLSCFQAALLNALCPIALSPFSRLSIHLLYWTVLCALQPAESAALCLVAQIMVPVYRKWVTLWIKLAFLAPLSCFKV